MIQKECKKCRKFSEAVSHGGECPWCEHPPKSISDPFKLIIVLAFVGLLAALWGALR